MKDPVFVFAYELNGETILETISSDARTCVRRLFEFMEQEDDDFEFEGTLLLNGKFISYQLEEVEAAERQGE